MSTVSKLEKKGLGAVAERSKRLERLKVEYVAIDAIKPNSYNPNRQSPDDFELLMSSIREDGFTQPVVVQRQTNEIVDGEHRWRAARQIGLTTIPVVFTDMSAEQMRISTLRHNRARGSEDVDLGIQVLRDLREMGALDWAQDSLGLSDAEMQKMLDDVPVAEALAGEIITEAWVPVKGTNAAFTTPELSREGVSVSSSVAAEKMQQALEARVKGTTNAAEKAQILERAQDESYRLVYSFKGDEAALLQEVLGGSPAQKLLELCKAEEAWAAVEA